MIGVALIRRDMGRPVGAKDRAGAAVRPPNEDDARRIARLAFAANLSDAMKERDVGPDELGAAVGAARSCVCSWLAARTSPPIWQVYRIAVSLGCTAEDLVRDM